MTTTLDHKATCLAAICDPDHSRNPVAWFDLEKEGLTRELLKEVSESPSWIGPPPVFKNAPDRESKIWKHLESGA